MPLLVSPIGRPSPSDSADPVKSSGAERRWLAASTRLFSSAIWATIPKLNPSRTATGTPITASRRRKNGRTVREAMDRQRVRNGKVGSEMIGIGGSTMRKKNKKDRDL